MKFLVFLLLLSIPAFCDTFYSFSGLSDPSTAGSAIPMGFDFDATTNAFWGGPQTGPGYDLPDWPWDIHWISFSPVMADAQQSTQMDLEMIDNDGSGGPISVWYVLIGFVPGEFGTYTADNLSGFGTYGTPATMTLTVTDPPATPDAPEPASSALALFGLLLIGCGFLRRVKRHEISDAQGIEIPSRSAIDRSR